jgi:hypothetical protein
MGRWRADTHTLVQDSMFFEVLKISEKTHRVIEHVMNFLSQSYTPAECEERGLQVHRLVCEGKASSLLSEFSNFFVEPEWACHASASGCFSDSEVSALLTLAVELQCHHAASFHRRIWAPLQQCLPQLRP